MRTRFVLGMALLVVGLFLMAAGVGVSPDLPFGDGGLLALVGFAFALQSAWSWARDRDRVSP
jgi:hypothetical protein